MTKDGRRTPVEISGNSIEYQGSPADMAIVRDITARKQAEAALSASEERYRRTLDGMLEGCQIIGFDWSYLYVNDTVCKQGHRTREELLGHTMMDIYPGIENTEMHARLRGCMESRQSCRMENEFAYPDGSKGWFELSIEPVPEGIFILSLDITERKKAEMEIYISQRIMEISNRCHDTDSLLQEFVKEVRDLTRCEAVGIRILGESGKIPYRAYTGFSRKFYEKESPLSINSDQCMCINVIRGTTNPGLPFYTAQGSFYMNGTTRFLATVSEAEKGKTRNTCNAAGYESVALIPIRFERGILGLVHIADHKENMVPLEMVRLLENVASVFGVGIQRALAEDALRRSEEVYRAIARNLPDGAVWVVDTELRCLVAEGGLLDRLGMVREQLEQHPLKEALDEQARQFMEERFRRSLAGQPSAFEGSYRGRVIWTQFVPLRDKTGRIGAAMALGLDTTERKQSEEKIRKLSTAVEQSPAIVLVTDANGVIEYVNPKFTQITGYEGEEIMGTNATSLGNPSQEDAEGMWNMLNAGQEWRGEFLNKKKTGELYWEAASIAPLRDADGVITHFVKVAENITERKLTEEALKESEERFRTILDNAVDGILAADLETKKFFTGNKAICRMLGYSLEELKHLGVADIHPEKDLPHVLEQFEKQSRGEFSLARDIPLKRRDGSVFYTEVNSSLLTFRRKTYQMGIFEISPNANGRNKKLMSATRNCGEPSGAPSRRLPG